MYRWCCHWNLQETDARDVHTGRAAPELAVVVVFNARSKVQKMLRDEVARLEGRDATAEPEAGENEV